MISTLPAVTDPRTLVRGVGRWVRNTRYTLGLSQDMLASLARTSQGSISRLESGRSLDTPLMTYLKAITALCREFIPFDATIPLAPYVKDAIAFASYIDPRNGDMPPPVSDEAFSTLLLRYASMSPAKRKVFLDLTEPLAKYLAE